MVLPLLIQAIRKQYQLSWGGIHGPMHWGRVMVNGLKLAEQNGANTVVIELFAVFHDACRINEDWDEGHGSRGANLAGLFRGKFFDLSDDDFNTLRIACIQHTDGAIHSDITIGTCWDADRLDFGRVGITPEKSRLCTEAAKQPEIFDQANLRACNEFVPPFVYDQWMNLNTVREQIK